MTALDALFRCPAIGRDLAVRLRRQFERRARRDGKGKVIALDVVNQACVGCETGREHRESIGDVPVWTCERCGSGVVESTECPTCTAERPALAPARPPVSSRLWTGEVPDVPIAPPPASRAARTPPAFAPELGTTGRCRLEDCVCGPKAHRYDEDTCAPPSPRSTPPPPRAEPTAPQAKDAPMLAERTASFEVAKQEVPTPPPAPPADHQEDAMETWKPGTPRPCCGSKGSRHMSGCKEAGKTAPKKASAPPAKKPAPSKPAKAPRRPAPATSAYVVPVGELTDDDLAKSVAQARAEIQRRKLEARARFERLEELERSISEAA